MPIYPIYPCCYCPNKKDPVCPSSEKVACNRFLKYIERLNNMSAYGILIKELKDLITIKGGK